MMKYTIALLILLSLTANSCEKNKYHTIIRGTVINYGSRKPIDSVFVVLKDGIASYGAFSLDATTASNKKNETLTNKSGEFEVELEGEHGAYLTIGKKGYYEYIYDDLASGYRPFPDGLSENVVLELKANCDFCGTFFASEPADSLKIAILTYNNINDFMPITWPDEFLCDYWKLCLKPDKPFLFCGNNNFYTSGLQNEIGDMFLRYKLNIKREGVWLTIVDSVYIKSFETYIDTIFY